MGRWGHEAGHVNALGQRLAAIAAHASAAAADDLDHLGEVQLAAVAIEGRQRRGLRAHPLELGRGARIVAAQVSVEQGTDGGRPAAKREPLGAEPPTVGDERAGEQGERGGRRLIARRHFFGQIRAVEQAGHGLDAGGASGHERAELYDYAGRGEIPCRRLGKRLLFSRQALVVWLSGCKIA
jgi:hypothetical protein